MDDFDALFVAIEKADPTDATPLLIAADWCDEHDRPDMAYALRWCAADGFRPFYRPDVKRYPWVWMRDQRSYRGMSKAQIAARGRATIPAPLFDLMRDNGNYHLLGYKTCGAAYLDLSIGLGNLRDIVQYSDLPAVVVKPSEWKLTVCPDCGMARDALRERCPVCTPTEARA